MPCAVALAGVIRACRLPSITIAPASGAMAPPSTFNSVDLPAPFSPTSPTTSPPATERSTSRSATAPG